MKFLTTFLLVFCLFQLKSRAQFSFKNDTDFKFYSDTLNKFAKIPPPDFSKADFEMRFYVRRLTNYPNQVFVFKHTLAGNWELTSYQFCSYHMTDFSELLVEHPKPSNVWMSRWDSLITNHVLKLPTESIVEKRRSSATNSIQVIADGVAYRFELFMKNKKRRYWYSNPETKLKEMGEEYPEFINAVKIIQILDNELGFNEKTLAECK
jgi:hypothetical protein